MFRKSYLVLYIRIVVIVTHNCLSMMHWKKPESELTNHTTLSNKRNRENKQHYIYISKVRCEKNEHIVGRSLVVNNRNVCRYCFIGGLSSYSKIIVTCLNDTKIK